MRHTELWDRLEATLGQDYAAHWSEHFVIAELGGKTAVEALADGVAPKVVWGAVWRALELPARDR